MRLSQTSLSRSRAGFTLVEVMIAVLIIAILTTMLLVGVRQAFATAKTVQARTEMTQLAAAITQFKLKFHVDDAPPSFIDITGGPDDNTAIINGYYRRMYPRDFAATSLTFAQHLLSIGVRRMEGPECLVFFLAGPPDGAGIRSGWGPPTNGFNVVNPSIPAFYEFPQSRLQVRPGQSAMSFLDPWGTNPYVYFSAFDYADPTHLGPNNPAATRPPGFGTGLSGATPGDRLLLPFLRSGTKAWNPTSFQIISAGPDKELGSNVLSNGEWWPGSGGYTAGNPGADDLSNFHDGPLGQQQ